MSEANRGKAERGYDSYGIMRPVSETGRLALARAVKRHRDHRGWSRQKMAEEASVGVAGPPPLSSSTIKNVENEKRSGDITGKTASAIERAFDWPMGTVSLIMAGHPDPDPNKPAEEETPAEEDDRSWSTFQSWPEDVKGAAMRFGALLALRTTKEQRQDLADEVLRMMLHGPL